MEKMTPGVERLVRLMILLPGHDHTLWDSLMSDCGEPAEVQAMRWFVGDAAKMWPPAGPANLAAAVLATFTAASEATLRILSGALLPGSPRGPQAGAAWVSQAVAAAVDVLAVSSPLEDVLQTARDHWTLRGGE